MAASSCPNCGNLAPDDAMYCGVCYEVLKKRPRRPPVDRVEAPLLAAVKRKWNWPVLAAAAVLFAGMALWRERLREALWPLDGVNIAFHEAGHPIFGILGLGNHWIMIAGGTLMQ